MKTLYLLRHAQAIPREVSLSDFDRPLDENGQKEAEAVAQHLQQKKIPFDFVMCSAALRAQETLEPLRPNIGTEAIEISKNFYYSPEDQILDHLRHVSDEKNCILYVGHNPRLAFAALKLAKTFPEVLKEGLMPATLIGFQFPITQWVDLNWWEGEVIDVFQPQLVLAPSGPPSQKES